MRTQYDSIFSSACREVIAKELNLITHKLINTPNIDLQDFEIKSDKLHKNIIYKNFIIEKFEIESKLIKTFFPQDKIEFGEYKIVNLQIWSKKYYRLYNNLSLHDYILDITKLIKVYNLIYFKIYNKKPKYIFNNINLQYIFNIYYLVLKSLSFNTYTNSKTEFIANNILHIVQNNRYLYSVTLDHNIKFILTHNCVEYKQKINNELILKDIFDPNNISDLKLIFHQIKNILVC